MKAGSFAIGAWTVVGLSCCAAVAAHSAGFSINVTPSVPVGLWRAIDASPTRGGYVFVCPEDTPVFRKARARGYLSRGECPDDFRPLIKPVAAMAGDVVEVSPAGITVNGARLPNTAQLARDGAGRLLPRYPAGRYVVPMDQVWLVSSYNRESFDSRYFGPVSTDHIESAARPVLVDSEIR